MCNFSTLINRQFSPLTDTINFYRKEFALLLVGSRIRIVVSLETRLLPWEQNMNLTGVRDALIWCKDICLSVYLSIHIFFIFELGYNSK